MGYMEIKIKPELPAELAGRIERFTLENFYTAKEKTPEGQTELRENFFSRPKAWLLALEEDEIIGTILLHRRRVKHKSQELILGGLGKVCTRKDRRSQGIATMMLEEAVKILKYWKCDVAYLCANIEETGPLYARVGFAPLNKPYTYYGRSGRLYERTSGMIAPINSPEIFKEIISSKQKFHIDHSNW
jgi:predicted N-acetyltransferase YhbS